MNKKQIENKFENGGQRIESRQPKTNEALIELELLKLKRERKFQLEQHILESRKKEKK